MPVPLPINLGSISQSPVQLDFIRRLPLLTTDVAGNTISPPIDYNEQRWETGFSFEESLDSKLRWQTDVFPFRMIYTGPAGWEYLKSIKQKWETIPFVRASTDDALLGSGMGWGTSADLTDYYSPGTFALADYSYSGWGSLLWTAASGNYVAHYWLYSAAVDSAVFGVYPYTVQVMQFLATRPITYEIWKVTIRDPVAGPDYPTGGFYQGYMPPVYPPIRSQTPWAGSSDFGKVEGLGGSLDVGDVLTISPHDLDPRHNCQTPPAATNDGHTPLANPSDGEWAGWGVANYLVITN